MRKLAISDIHGCKKSFEALLDRIAFSKGDLLYLLGDYVDRGPDSKGVIDLIWELQRDGYQLECLRGNHEELVLRAASGNFTFLEKWLKTDGKDTMDSFGVSQCADIPQEYIRWMDALPYYLEVDNYLLVHSGLDFRLEDPLSDTMEMCWLRDWYHTIRYDWLKDRIIIHGHTPLDVETIDNFVDRNPNDVLVFGPNGKTVRARTQNQKKMVLAADKNDIVFAIGPAGTGKTYTAVALAVRALKNKLVKKIILTRPAVEAGESLGFLPGDLKEKIDPYLRPLYDALDDMIPADKLGYYMSTRTIEIAPLAYMRGRTLDNAFIILDEAFELIAAGFQPGSEYGHRDFALQVLRSASSRASSAL